MDKNICEACGTENEQEYRYCKNCGNEIKSEPQPEIKEEPVQQEPNQTADFMFSDDFNGVSNEEMAIFIGKKADKILPKFTKMQLTGSKTSWAWPVAILGFLFGPMGSALWFFYRKMYKPAIILAILGAVITALTGVMTLGTTEIVPESAIDAFIGGNYEAAIEIIDDAEKNVTTSQKILNTVASFITDTTDILTCVLTGIYGYYVYKKHCIKKISEYRAQIADNRFYKIGLAAVGGQSGGMLAVGIVLIFAAQSIVNFIGLIYSISI